AVRREGHLLSEGLFVIGTAHGKRDRLWPGKHEGVVLFLAHDALDVHCIAWPVDRPVRIDIRTFRLRSIVLKVVAPRRDQRSVGSVMSQNPNVFRLRTLRAAA